MVMATSLVYARLNDEISNQLICTAVVHDDGHGSYKRIHGRKKTRRTPVYQREWFFIV